MRLLVPCLCLVLVLCAAGCTATPPAAPAPTPTPPAPDMNLSAGHTTAQMVAFVHDAAAFARSHGQEEAVAAFMNRSGPFFQDDLYIYAYDFDGVTLAHPVQRHLVGTNRLDDRESREIGLSLRNAALNGTGFVRFPYINPAHENATETKLGYVERVDETWWVGSGVYMPVDPDPTAETVALVEKAVRFAQANGKAKALAAFSDPNGSFVSGDRYIFAYDLDGTVLALPADPARVGTSHWDLIDPNGVRMVRQMRSAALEGGGFVTYTTDHRLNRPGLWEKHVYVAMAGEDWFVGSGTYAD